MNGANIGTFDLSVPSDTESMALTDDRIRSVKSTLQQVLDDEHAFPSAGGNNVGYHRLGSARPYYGVQSAVSSAGTDGRLMVTSDTSRLFHVGSGGTMLLGAGPGALSIGSGPTFPQRHIWVEEVGLAITNSSGSTVVVLPNSGYSGAPFIFAQNTLAHVSLIARNVTATQFEIQALDVAALSFHSGAQFYWRSLGTRAL